MFRTINVFSWIIYGSVFQWFGRDANVTLQLPTNSTTQNKEMEFVIIILLYYFIPWSYRCIKYKVLLLAYTLLPAHCSLLTYIYSNIDTTILNISFSLRMVCSIHKNVLVLFGSPFSLCCCCFGCDNKRTGTARFYYNNNFINIGHFLKSQ